MSQRARRTWLIAAGSPQAPSPNQKSSSCRGDTWRLLLALVMLLASESVCHCWMMPAIASGGGAGGLIELRVIPAVSAAQLARPGHGASSSPGAGSTDMRPRCQCLKRTPHK